MLAQQRRAFGYWRARLAPAEHGTWRFSWTSDDGTRRWKKFADEAAAESWLRQNLLVELPAPDEDRPSSNTRGVKWCSERGLWKVQVLDPKTGKRKYGGRFANLKTAERKAEEMRVQFSQQEASGAKAKRDPGRG